MQIEHSLLDLGYDEFFDRGRKDLGAEERSLARVVAEYKEVYRVRDASGECLARVTGERMYNAEKREDYPAVGDWVTIIRLDAENAIIRAILPRRTVLKKKYSRKEAIQLIAANIDTAFVVESADRDYNLNRFERYFVLASAGGIKPAIILNKTDLFPAAELAARLGEIWGRFGDIDVIPTSTKTDQGLRELVNYIQKGRTYCFLGSSGVGKSSLINKLLGEEKIKTQKLSGATGKGRHTTTVREMYFLGNGGIVIDNPGMREVGMAEARAGIDDIFEEITILSEGCRYADCTHVHEAGCAVRKAVEERIVDEGKYENYLKLKKENEHYSSTEFERREKDRKFGKFVKKALEQIKETEP